MNQEEKKTCLNEGELEGVAGGTIKGVCFFEPEEPLNKKEVDGFVAIKCKSKCHPIGSVCSCHGSFRCSDKFHRMETVSDMWVAFPALENNHGAPEKRVKII